MERKCVASQKRALKRTTTYTFTLHDGRFWNHESVLETQLAEKGIKSQILAKMYSFFKLSQNGIISILKIDKVKIWALFNFFL